jgi:hypothetical protein
MFPLEIPELIQRVIVSAVISIASTVILYILFKSRKSKSGGCNKCDDDH